MPTLVGDSIFHVLILEDWQVDFHMASRPPVASLLAAWCECLEPPGSTRPSWHPWSRIDAELWSLSNPQSGKGKGNGGGAGHSSCCPWPQSFCNAWPHSWYDGLGFLLGLPPSFNGCWRPCHSQRPALIAEVEWCWCRWDGARMSRSSWFDASFGDGLGDQLPALIQASRLDSGACLLPGDGWQGEWGIPFLTQTQSFS